MKQKVSYFAIGLFLGLVLGFVVTNHLNRPEFAVGRDAKGGAAPMAASAPGGPAGQTGADPDDPHAGGGGQEISDEELQHIAAKVDERADSYQDQIMFADYLLKMRHQPKEAIKYYERANKLKPDEVKPIVGLGDSNFDAAAPDPAAGRTTYDTKMLETAASYYERALKIDPKDVNVRTDLGLTYFFRTPPDVDRAVAEYRKSLSYEPKHEITLRNLTAALTAKGDYEGAEAALAELEAASPANDAIPQLRANIEHAREGKQIPSH